MTASGEALLRLSEAAEDAEPHNEAAEGAEPHSVTVEGAEPHNVTAEGAEPHNGTAEGTLRLDDMENGFHLYQDPSLFCFGIDAVLLAHFPKLMEGDRICDLGTGFAPVPHILAARARDEGLQISVTGLEIGERAAAAARASVRYNRLKDVIRIDSGDLAQASEYYGKQAFSMVITNPPYMPAGSGRIGDDPEKAAARMELLCTLADVVREGAALLKESGRFVMVHRPFRLPEIFSLMREARLEPKRMRLVCPRIDAAPNMVLVEGVKGGRPHLICEAPLIVYGGDGRYTDEVLRIYGKSR